MATVTTASPTLWTVADLLAYFGPIPAYRIRHNPPPGMATEQDVINIGAHEDRLCELYNGVLVEKTVGYYESRLAVLLVYFLESYLEKHDLGIALGADGTVRLFPGQVRIPDASFYSWNRFPNRQLPAKPIPDLVPDLAVEVLSESNTKKEMDRKLREYFKAGTRLVWYVDPNARSGRVYTSPRKSRLVTEDQTLNGGDVLPGFALPLRKLFARAGRRQGR